MVLPVVFLVGLLTLSNVYEKVKIFEIIKSRKPRANIDDPFDLKQFFSYINIPDNPADTDVFKTSSGRLEKFTTSCDQTRRDDV